MATSSNGWIASPNLPLRPLVVAGEPFTPGILDNDDVFTVLQYVAEQLHERVEPIVRADWHQADDWGFAFRDNRNDPNSLSNHASGTAFDYNATRHPNGVPTRDTFTREQIGTIHLILAEVDEAVRWGGDFNHPDAMHFEINTKPANLHKIAQRIRNEQEASMPLNTDDLAAIRSIVKDEVAAFAKAGGASIRIDDDLDPKTPKLSLERVLEQMERLIKKAQEGK